MGMARVERGSMARVRYDGTRVEAWRLECCMYGTLLYCRRSHHSHPGPLGPEFALDLGKRQESDGGTQPCVDSSKMHDGSEENFVNLQIPNSQ